MTMNDLEKAFAEEAELSMPSTKELSNIEELAKRQKDLEDSINSVEGELDELKKQHDNITGVLLPEALGGITGFTLSDGTKLKVQKIYRGHISKENQSKAFAWLRDNGFEDLIKNQVIMRFGKGEDERADALMNKLEKDGEVFENKKEVHSQTLKAFIREQLEAGIDLPHDLFGVYEGKRTKIEKGI